MSTHIHSSHRSSIIVTGFVGLFAALITGTGEFILHFDPLARFSGYAFFEGMSAHRTSIGHFIAMLGAPLYLIGLWHLHLMLRPANARWSMASFLVGSYGFVLGAVWIGSRASVSALTNQPEVFTGTLLELYEFRYESLLQMIRVAVLLLSAVFIWLTLSGRSLYPRWMAAFNPILLTLWSFMIYAMFPTVGKFLMPIALNLAFAVLFGVSLTIANKVSEVTS